MSKPTAIRPANDLTNIPHMLRSLAADIERGDEPMPRTILLVAVGDGNTPPDVFQFGGELSRLEEAGALYACIHRMLQMEQA